MPDQPEPNKLPPPGGDQQRAESYVKQLIALLSDNKLLATHTDLTKFDPSALHDHYRINIQNYQLEISHSKQPATGKDIYVLLFINSPNIDDFYNAHGIIAYLILSDDQFKRFKAIADEQIETRRKVEEEKRFARAVKPIDELLEKIAQKQIDAEDKSEKTKPEPVVKPPVAPNPPSPQPLSPTLEDIQKVLQQVSKEPTPQLPPVEENHNLDIPKVETLPMNNPVHAPEVPFESSPLPTPAPTPILDVPTQPEIPTVSAPPSQPAPLATNLAPVQSPALPIPDQAKSVPEAIQPQSAFTPTLEGNVLTESTPTGSQAPAPSGIDQAIDKAFQASGNNSITTQTPPISTN